MALLPSGPAGALAALKASWRIFVTSTWELDGIVEHV
jgi:hypothetical protein